MKLITGHNLVQPKPADAPLEFTFEVGDAELLARCGSAVDGIRAKREEDALVTELEAEAAKLSGGAK